MEKILADFVDLLAQLSRELKQLFDTGDISVLADMHATVKGMYAIQHGNEDDVIRTVDPDCEVIYRNFDMILSLLRTVEGDAPDRGAQQALNKFLHNINEGLVNIVTLFGLV